MLHAILSQRASERPDKPAIIQGQRRVTYGELDLWVLRMASFLVRHGLQKGDRIGIMSRNSPEYVAAYLGIQSAGGIAVDISYQASSPEIMTIANHCHIAALIVENSRIDEIADAVRKTPSIRTIIGMERRARGFSAVRKKIPAEIEYVVLGDIIGGLYGTQALPDTAANDVAAIIYTSDVARKPRGVMLSHENFVANARSIIDHLKINDRDRIMVVLPFGHSFGKSLLTTHLTAGGTLVLENNFANPDTVFDKMVEEEVTGFAGVPSTFAAMLSQSNLTNYRFPQLRYVIQAGGAIPPQHAHKIAELLPHASVHILYGQTEATAHLTCLELPDLLQRPGSLGRPLAGVEIDVVQDEAGGSREGEIAARGKNVMIGYWNDPGETSRVLKDGRLHTGDIGRMDADGYLYSSAAGAK